MQSTENVYVTLNWYHVAETLIGTFAGAALAYLGGVRSAIKQQRLKDDAGLRAAIMVFYMQFNTFLTIRRTANMARDKYLLLQPGAPIWNHYTLMPAGIDKQLTQDSASLTFLFADSIGANLMNALIYVQWRYQLLGEVHDNLNTARRTFNANIAAMQILHPTLPILEIVKLVPANQESELTSQTQIFFHMLEADGPAYEKAKNDLNAQSKIRFGKEHLESNVRQFPMDGEASVHARPFIN